MKRIIVLLLMMIITFCSCSNVGIVDADDNTLALVDDADVLGLQGGLEDEGGFFIGSWLSYIEVIPKNLKGKKEEYTDYIRKLIQNLKKLHVNNLFVQVRPFCDAIYPSDIFPSSIYAVEKQGDPLPFDYFSVIIEQAEKCQIKVHAWINPYRVQKDIDIDGICNSSFAKQWYSSKNDNIVDSSGGLYLNPASVEVQQKIISGIKEILNNYSIAGIHIDDYFYPTTDESFDKSFYKKYKKENGSLNLASWRRENVNTLLSAVYNVVKSYGKDKVFSISPGGDIEKNKNQLYADVERWCSEQGYCDIIIPQLYYGFENETMPFARCADSWKKLVKNDVKLCAGLALYKSGKEDIYAGSGKNEWMENSDIIKRQTEYAKENGFYGICLYSASFVNFNETSCAKETKNLLDVIK